MKKLFFLILILQINFVMAQSTFKLNGRVNNLAHSKIYLLDFYGLENTLVDSTNANSAGFFSFVFDETTPVGLYRLIFENKHWDFIYNREEIQLLTDYYYLVDSMDIIKSVENQLLNNYLRFLRQIDQKIKSLEKLKEMYIVNDEFYSKIEEEIFSLQYSAPRNYVDDLIENNEDTFVARFLKTEQFPFVNDSIDEEEKLNFITDHMFDRVDFNDTTLIRSPVYIQKVRTYFSLINNKRNSNDIEQAYIRGLNSLMSKAAVNEKVFNFILKDIADGFEKSDFDTFFAYLLENYLLDSSCKNEEETRELKERLEYYKKLAVGNIAPDFQIVLEDSTHLVLSEMENPYKLLLFWAGWCGHCKLMLPAIKDIYDKYNKSGFEVVAISLDNVEEEWKNAIEEGNYYWVNYSELNGWNGTIALEYGIRATPAFFLLDRNNTIILRPRTTDQLRRKLDQLF
ncbi:MAG: redoxin domain-containing protein [Bacteroidetes bacterium]|nr:redoxin domain-containing protein [Bacteroidota bacterium]